jgi:hypothetical protein
MIATVTTRRKPAARAFTGLNTTPAFHAPHREELSISGLSFVYRGTFEKEESMKYRMLIIRATLVCGVDRVLLVLRQALPSIRSRYRTEEKERGAAQFDRRSTAFFAEIERKFL